MRLLFFIIAVSSPVLFCGNRIEVLNTTAGKIQVYGFTFASKNCKQKVVSSSQTIERGERQTFYSKFVSKNEDCRFFPASSSKTIPILLIQNSITASLWFLKMVKRLSWWNRNDEKRILNEKDNNHLASCKRELSKRHNY